MIFLYLGTEVRDRSTFSQGKNVVEAQVILPYQILSNAVQYVSVDGGSNVEPSGYVEAHSYVSCRLSLQLADPFDGPRSVLFRPHLSLPFLVIREGPLLASHSPSRKLQRLP